MNHPTVGHRPDHYENFPVASWLSPRQLRDPISAIYRFARTADDIADEGHASADQRLKDLQQMRHDLANTSGNPDFESVQWPNVFGPLGKAIRQFLIPLEQLSCLLDAFAQDVIMTRAGKTYTDLPQLLDYCRHSANPVGRLMLHLYGISDSARLAMSDSICSSLQLINFWQDLSVDIPRNRHYLTDSDCRQFQVSRETLAKQEDTPQTRKLIRYCVKVAQQMMLDGAPLAHQIPGRAGWELRLVVQGGLRILEKIELLHFRTLRIRPKIGKVDIAIMAWRAVWM